MTAPFSTAQLDALNAVNGEAAAEIMRLRSELHAANMRLSEAQSRLINYAADLSNADEKEMNLSMRLREIEPYAIQLRDMLRRFIKTTPAGGFETPLDRDADALMAKFAWAIGERPDDIDREFATLIAEESDDARTVGKRNDNPGWATILPGSER